MEALERNVKTKQNTLIRIEKKNLLLPNEFFLASLLLTSVIIKQT